MINVQGILTNPSDGDIDPFLASGAAALEQALDGHTIPILRFGK
jgi:hypothetical protein